MIATFTLNYLNMSSSNEERTECLNLSTCTSIQIQQIIHQGSKQCQTTKPEGIRTHLWASTPSPSTLPSPQKPLRALPGAQRSKIDVGSGGSVRIKARPAHQSAINIKRKLKNRWEREYGAVGSSDEEVAPSPVRRRVWASCGELGGGARRDEIKRHPRNLFCPFSLGWHFWVHSSFRWAENGWAEFFFSHNCEKLTFPPFLNEHFFYSLIWWKTKNCEEMNEENYINITRVY